VIFSKTESVRSIGSHKAKLAYETLLRQSAEQEPELEKELAAVQQRLRAEAKYIPMDIYYFCAVCS
jgi:hypothetical protein